MKMSRQLIFFLACFLHVQCYKILVYNPKFGHSHSLFMGRIADILAEEGHEVISLIPVLKKHVKDGTTKSKVIHILPANSESEAKVESHVNYFTNDMFTFTASYWRGKRFGVMFQEMCNMTLQEDRLLEDLQQQEFDVYIAENFDGCGVELAEIIKAKAFIMTTSSVFTGDHYDDVGIPQVLSMNPSYYTGHMDVHSMWDRAMNLYAEIAGRTIFQPARDLNEALFRAKYGPSFPSIREISSRAAYLFENTDPLIDFAHPTLHKVIGLGGIGINEPKPLDEKWEEILGRRPRSVLISFGSIARSDEMPLKMKQSIVQSIANFPDTTFIWKYETVDEFSTAAAFHNTNLMFEPWTPQNDLLNDPRIVAFVSHAGMASTMETATRGVPALFVPIFADQPRNAGMLQHNGIGLVFNKYDLDDSHKLTSALKEVLDNPRILNNAKEMSRKLARKPFKPRELLVKYVEYAAEFGPSSALRPTSHEISVLEYYNFDIAFLILIFLITLVYLSLKFILILCNCKW